jgi:uncharacterized protein (UPF0332 family)
MNIEYGECLKKGRIKEFSRGKEIAPAELQAAESDLKRAEKTFNDNDYKWTMVQLYYSMFHTARALLYNKNLREHSHYCLIQAIRCLYVEENKLPFTFVEALNDAKALREDADYYNRWSKEASEKFLKSAREFLDCAKKIVLGE